MRKLLITISSLVVVVLVCLGAASIDYNTYMNNAIVYTNVMAKTATITNGITAGASTFTGAITTTSISTPLLEVGQLTLSNLVAGFVAYDGAVITNGTGKATSANLSTILSDETGSGVAVFGTSPTFNTQITINGGTLAGASTPVINAFQTWNNAGTTFTGHLLNITNMASAAASLVMDLQTDGTSQFKVTKAGAVTTVGDITTLNVNTSSGGGINGYSGAGGTGNRTFLITAGAIPKLALASAGYLGFGSSVTDANTTDTFIYRDSAAVLQLGADAATATAQTIKAHDGSGSDKAGANLTIEGGQGTGTSAGGSVILRTSLTGASSASSVNAYQDRARYPAKFITLTDNTVTSLFTVTLPATNSVGISWTCTIMAGNATDFQSLTTVGTIDGVAKTTTITTVGTPTAAQTALAGSAGTLSVTYTFVDLGSNVMALRVTADTDLASLAYLRAKIELTGIACHGAGVVINEL